MLAGAAGGLDVGGVEAVVAVVGCAFGGVAEDVVGGGDAGEALAGGWVGAVAVWVVAEGEGVELSGVDVRVGGVLVGWGEVLFDLGCGGGYGEVEDFVVILFAGEAGACG